MKSSKPSRIMELQKSSGVGFQQKTMQKNLYAPSSGWRALSLSNSLPFTFMFPLRAPAVAPIVSGRVQE